MFFCWFLFSFFFLADLEEEAVAGYALDGHDQQRGQIEPLRVLVLKGLVREAGRGGGGGRGARTRAGEKRNQKESAQEQIFKGDDAKEMCGFGVWWEGERRRRIRRSKRNEITLARSESFSAPHLGGP